MTYTAHTQHVRIVDRELHIPLKRLLWLFTEFAIDVFVIFAIYHYAYYKGYEQARYDVKSTDSYIEGQKLLREKRLAEGWREINFPSLYGPPEKMLVPPDWKPKR